MSENNLKSWRVSAFLRDAPEYCVVRGYEGEFDGIVVEYPSPTPAFEGEMIELAYLHNDGKIEITEAGSRYFMPVDDD